MNLFFYENLSRRLVDLLAAEFPGSTHPELKGMRGTTDKEIWDCALDRGFMIVSKGNDFRQRAFVYGPPPKVIWLAVGNATTDSIAGLRRSNVAEIAEFAARAEESLLVVTPLDR